MTFVRFHRNNVSGSKINSHSNLLLLIIEKIYKKLSLPSIVGERNSRKNNSTLDILFGPDLSSLQQLFAQITWLFFLLDKK